MVIYVDVDETICTVPENRERRYENMEPIKENIEKINELYDKGHQIIYWTARGSKTGLDWNELLLQQLKEWGAKYHEAKTGKPFYDLIIDDKALTSVKDLRI